MAIREFIESSAANVDKGEPKSVLWQITELLNDIMASLDAMNDISEFEQGLDGVIGGDYSIATQADPALLGAGRIKWRRDGQIFEMALQVSIALGDDGDITQNKYRAWRIEIADTGAVTAVAGGDLESTTAEQALMALGSIAQTALTVEIAYIVFNDETGAFNIGTTNTGDSENEAIHYCRMPRQRAAGLTADMVPVLAIGSSNDEFSHGTVDAKVEGVGVAQIALDATQAWNAADIITSDEKYGGHLLVTDLAGTDVISLAATGLLEGAQTMDYATSVLAHAALDNVQARLPVMFAVLGRCVTLAAKATFTFNTDDGAGTDGTFVFTSETFADFDRTDQSGTGQGVAQPTIPSALDTIAWRLLGTP